METSQLADFTGPEFAILNVLGGVSTFWIEGDKGGGAEVDIERHAGLSREERIASDRISPRPANRPI